MCEIYFFREKIADFHSNMQRYNLQYTFDLNGLLNPQKYSSQKRKADAYVSEQILEEALKNPDYNFSLMKKLMSACCILS
jgi:hypothetical protein